MVSLVVLKRENTHLRAKVQAQYEQICAHMKTQAELERKLEISEATLRIAVEQRDRWRAAHNALTVNTIDFAELMLDELKKTFLKSKEQV